MDPSQIDLNLKTISLVNTRYVEKEKIKLLIIKDRIAFSSNLKEFKKS